MSQFTFFIPYSFLTDMSKQDNESKLKYSLSVRVNDTQNELNMEFSFVGDDYPDIAILSSMTKCLGRLLLRSNNTTNIDFLSGLRQWSH